MSILSFVSAAIADPIGSPCSPVPPDNSEWAVTYNYFAADRDFSGSNTLFIGKVDSETQSHIPGYMEITHTGVFLSFYEPDSGLKLEWILSYGETRFTNEVIISTGVNTQASIGVITYSVEWRNASSNRVQTVGAKARLSQNSSMNSNPR